MKNKKALIFLSFLFLFFTYMLNLNVSPLNSFKDVDSSAYLKRADLFYKTGSFVDHQNQADVPYYSLGYAFFIGLIYKVFGQNINIVILIQIFLALLSGFLIYKISNILFNKSVALVAFFLFTINLGFIVFSLFILTEILLGLLLLSFLYYFVIFLEFNNNLDLILAGIFLGLSVTVKPAAIYFVFFVILFLLLRSYLKMILLSQNFKNIFLFIVSFYLPVLSYMGFNKVTFGYFSVAPIAKESLYFYFLPKIMAFNNGTDWVYEQKKLSGMVVGNKLKDESWQNINNIFVEEVLKDPFNSVFVWMQNVTKTFLGLYTNNLKVLVDPKAYKGELSFFKTEGRFKQKIWNYITGSTDYLYVKIIGILEFFYNFIRYIFCFLALLFLFFKKDYEKFWLLIFYIFYFSIITGHDGCARFRMMFEPVLIILTAYGFLEVFNKKIKIFKLNLEN